MVETHTWNVNMQESYALVFVSYSIPSVWQMNTAQNVTCTVRNIGTSSVGMSVNLAARPLKPTVGKYVVVPSSLKCSTALIAPQGTFAYSIPVIFNDGTPGPVAPPTGCVTIPLQATSASYWAPAGQQIRIVANIWTSANCGLPPISPPTYVEQSSSDVYGCLATINAAQTTYYSSCDVGSACDIVSLGIKNTGNEPCLLRYRIYNIPGSGGTPNNPVTGILTTPSDVAVGATSVVVVNIPAPAEGWYTYGVKVWGSNEGEPTGFSLILGQRLDTKSIVLGLAVVGGIVGLLWYTKKKKMW